MSDRCKCGFEADAPKTAQPTDDPMCIECFAAKRPDVLSGFVVKAAWLPSMTQEEVSNSVRVLAYCAAYPKRIRKMLSEKLNGDGEASADLTVVEVGDATYYFSSKDLEAKIEAAAKNRMKDVFLVAIDKAVDLFGSSDVKDVQALIEENPGIRSDAEIGLRVIPLTFDTERMSKWPIEEIIVAAKSEFRSL